MRIAERGERIEARTDDDGRRHGVRIEVRPGYGVRIEERRGDDGAGTTARGRRRDGVVGTETTAARCWRLRRRRR